MKIKVVSSFVFLYNSNILYMLLYTLILFNINKIFGGSVYISSYGDGIPVELFQILKDGAMKVLHPVCQQIWKAQQVATGLEKISFHFNPKEEQCQ